jgi:trans-aconitate methyltransferase
MERVPEPELMLDETQAVAYASADFAEPHNRCVDLLSKKHPDLPSHGRALDLGCGPGDMTVRLARALPAWTIDALDGSPVMLDLAREAAARNGVQSRLRFSEAVIPHGAPPDTGYDLIFSNSLLHHLEEPRALWSGLIRWGRPGSFVFVADLMRPESEAEARGLVERYASSEPEVLQRDFYNSLRAAYRPEEVRVQLADAGLGHLALEVISDRHFVVWGRLPLDQR